MSKPCAMARCSFFWRRGTARTYDYTQVVNAAVLRLSGTRADLQGREGLYAGNRH
ncbi:MAG TPA: hypothetical protein VGF67_02755 [Ktedonobacteraceae bacterium]